MIGIAPPVIVRWPHPMWFAARLREQLANGERGNGLAAGLLGLERQA
jgi:hypothetical protein